MNFTFLVVVLLTALAFVGVVIALSRAISPRSYNLQKFEAYECGIPTRGKSWMQFRVGYYLFAIPDCLHSESHRIVRLWLQSICRDTASSFNFLDADNTDDASKK